MVGADSELFNSWELKSWEQATYVAGNLQLWSREQGQLLVKQQLETKIQKKTPEPKLSNTESRGTQGEPSAQVRVCPTATGQCQAMTMVATGNWPMLLGTNCPVAVPSAPEVLWLKPPFNLSSPKVLSPIRLNFQNTFLVSPILNCIYLHAHSANGGWPGFR